MSESTPNMDDNRKTSETEMERMQRQALEEQAAGDSANAATMSIEQMQKEAAAEQASSDIHQKESMHFRDSLNHYLFDMNNPVGKIVNYTILLLIITSVFASMLDTLPDIRAQWGEKLVAFQLGVLYIFLIEYLLRIYAAKNRKNYVAGIYGIIDLLTVLPIFFGGSGTAVIRLFRLFRIVRLAQFFPVLTTLLHSISEAKGMIIAVLATISAVSVFSGNIAYLLEPETFHNAFIGTWWSLVTMSTVGYGDLIPHSTAGMVLGAALILVGICVVAMMTAVIAVRVGRMVNMTNECFECRKSVAAEYSFCPYCGQDQSDEIYLFTDED